MNEFTFEELEIIEMALQKRVGDLSAHITLYNNSKTLNKYAASTELELQSTLMALEKIKATGHKHFNELVGT